MKIECSNYENQIDIIPSICMFIHHHGWDFENDKRLWHFHFIIQWIKYYFELTIGKE